MTAARPLERGARWALWTAVPCLLAGVADAQVPPQELDPSGAPNAVEDASGPSTDDATADDWLPRDPPQATESRELAIADPLTVGGLLYLRLQVSALERQPVADYNLGVPSLLDVFLDSRPNERVRGFVLGRMTYDPMLPTSNNDAPALGTLAGNSGPGGIDSLSSLLVSQTNAPRVVLDQLWLRFDVGRTLFITAGRQHVRWGTARFWMPADLLHLRRRNPLAVFDARTGTTMLKLHLPVESRAWNFYAYGLAENQDGTPSLKNVAGALRLEFVAGSSELGLGVLGRVHTRPKFVAEFSIGLGDFDLYAEAAFLDASEIDRVYEERDPRLPDRSSTATPADLADALRGAVEAFYPVYRGQGYKPQAVFGATLTAKYGDSDTLTWGAEYFYNALGYQSPRAYPGLLLPHPEPLQNPASFFYLGVHYAALFVTLPAPFRADLHTFTLSTLGNLSDRSFITRFDYAFVLLTHLQFEAFAAGHYGERSGEFRFGVLGRAPASFDLGLALRLSS